MHELHQKHENAKQLADRDTAMLSQCFMAELPSINLMKAVDLKTIFEIMLTC